MHDCQVKVISAPASHRINRKEHRICLLLIHFIQSSVEKRVAFECENGVLKEFKSCWESGEEPETKQAHHRNQKVIIDSETSQDLSQGN